MSLLKTDTIAAISTPLGEGALGIVRLSGPSAIDIAAAIFRWGHSCQSPTTNWPTHTVHYGHILSSDGNDVIDEVMLTVMRAPRTYTREDVIEISCHGGAVTLKNVLERCLGAGARLAEPGEFTKRAFLNGRIDLSQAEAVIDIIKAETASSMRIALGQLKGELSGEIKEIRAAILDILSRVEVMIDFSQEDVVFPSHDELTLEIEAAASMMKKIASTSDKGIMLRHGASVVICGRPNVGKSSLMNALLRHDRVIVTPQAGTTRDVIEESIELAGVKVRLSDTAGIIETTDRVELEGIRRSKEKLETADAVIFLVDGALPLTAKDGEIFDTIKDKKVIVAANKADLPSGWDEKDLSRKFGGRCIIRVSALKRSGLDELEDAVAKALFNGDTIVPDGPVVTNLRHKDILDKAAVSAERALSACAGGHDPALVASDLNEAVHLLGTITGETVEDGVLDRIFSRFCIGK